MRIVCLQMIRMKHKVVFTLKHIKKKNRISIATILLSDLTQYYGQTADGRLTFFFFLSFPGK